jgi:MFS family permease
LGLYGHSVYLAEFQGLEGWGTTVISTANTLSLLLGNLLATFSNDVLAWIGPRRLILLGISALAASTTLLAFTGAPWQLYVAYMLMAVSWAGMGTVVVATLLRSWFDRRSGLAISLAFNGATCGGIIVAPTLILLVGTVGFTWAILTMTVAMIAILGPVMMTVIDLPAASGAPERLPEDSPRSRNVVPWQIIKKAMAPSARIAAIRWFSKCGEALDGRDVIAARPIASSVPKVDRYNGSSVPRAEQDFY